MAEFDYQKLNKEGSELMMKSLECLKNGDMEGSKKFREEANKILDLATQSMNTACANMDMLYGESRNFGIIYNVFEQNIKEMMKSKDGRKAISEAVKLIKKDKNLKSQFNVYQSFERKPSNHAEMYIEEALKMMPRSTRKEIVESNEKLINVLRESKNFNEMLDIDDNVMKCYESVETLMMTPHTPENLDKIVEARQSLLEHLSNLPVDEVKKSVANLEETYKQILKREGDTPNEHEIRLFRQITEAKDKKQLFEQYKNELVEEIENIMANKPEDLNEWAEAYELVKSQRFDRTQPYLSIGNLAELRNAIIK